MSERHKRRGQRPGRHGGNAPRRELAAPRPVSRTSRLFGPPLWVCLALIAANVLVYAPVRQFDFVNWDDPDYVIGNPAVADGLTWRGVKWAATAGYSANWHPLTWISHMLDIQLFGWDAGWHHITSLLLHIGSTLLLFLVLHGMTGALGRSAFVAALFGVHPLHVESVAWIAERKDVLSTFLGMLTLWAYLRYVRSPRWDRYLLVVAFFALGLTAKPMLVTLPFVLLLLDVWPLGRVSLGDNGKDRPVLAHLWDQRQTLLRLVREKAPLLALTVASAIVTFAVQQRDDAVTGLDELSLTRRVGNAVWAYVAYVGEALWPTRLAVVYPYPRPLPEVWTVALAAGLVGVTVLAMRAARRCPYACVGWLWYLGTLVPVIGLVQVGSQTMADRYTYVPLVGLFVVAAWGASDLLARFRHPDVALATAGAIVIVGSATAARAQVQHWRSSTALWEHALAVTSENARAHNNLGNALADEGLADEAVAHYEEALRINPDFAEPHNNLGNALARRGKLDEAVTHFREAVRLAPANPLAHNGLGFALEDQGKVDEAIAHYTEALRFRPDFAEAHNNLGAALARQGKIDEAIEQFLSALRIKPMPDIHCNVASMLASRGRTAEAIRHLESALALDPNHAAARQMLETLTRDGPGAPRPN